MRAALAIALYLLAAAGAARAQMLPPDQSLVRFSRYTSVRERMIPGYEAAGIPLGSFRLSPTLDIEGEYNDNILALDAGRIGDALARVTPAAVLQSDWARRSLTISGSAQLERFAEQESENREQFEATAYGIQELGDSTRVRLIGRYIDGRESRESQNAVALTERPVRFDTATVAAGLSQRFASLLVSGEAGITRYDFADARLRSTGALFDQDFRDAEQVRLRMRAELLQTPSLAYFIQGTRDETDYDERAGGGSGRGSTTYELLGGARFELPVAARGEIGVGYVRADFQGAELRRFSGVAINSRVLFFPTQLTTITVNATRSVNDAGTPNSSGYVALVGGVSIDHELRRTVILGANVQYERDRFNGIDRLDKRLNAGATADYRLNRNLWLRARYEYFDISSNGADRYRSFGRNRATIGLSLRV